MGLKPETKKDIGPLSLSTLCHTTRWHETLRVGLVRFRVREMMTSPFPLDRPYFLGFPQVSFRTETIVAGDFTTLGPGTGGVRTFETTGYLLLRSNRWIYLPPSRGVLDLHFSPYYRGVLRSDCILYGRLISLYYLVSRSCRGLWEGQRGKQLVHGNTIVVLSGTKNSLCPVL